MARVDVESGAYNSGAENRGPVEDAPGSYGADVTSSASSSDTMDASGLPFSFNPPLHPHARFWRPDLGSSKPAGERAAIYDETRNVYGKNALETNKFTDLRLGRIVMGNQNMSWALMDADTRYGFRFLYNPETIQRGTNVGTDFIPDPGSTLNFMLQEGLERISFEVLLNRIPDVNGPASRGEYRPKAIKQYDMNQIKLRGTHYDLEYLYRCANGLQHSRVRKNTGDIGILLPNPCVLVIGGQKTRGALESIQATDQMFSIDMVPILTYVKITFVRYLQFQNDDYSKLESIGIRQEGGLAGGDDTEDSDESSDGGSGGSTPSVPSGEALTGRQVYDLAREVGFTPTQAEIMTNIAWGESSWIPDNRNFCCHGLWQMNYIEHGQKMWMKNLGVKKASDLYDPLINAKAAKYLFDNGQPNYGDWEAYFAVGWGNWKFKWRR